ncbi:Glutamine synthetase [Psidium guajava]|nr:Glutamine synthetase [Psidium guajava]
MAWTFQTGHHGHRQGHSHKGRRHAHGQCGRASYLYTGSRTGTGRGGSNANSDNRATWYSRSDRRLGCAWSWFWTVTTPCQQ